MSRGVMSPEGFSVCGADPAAPTTLQTQDVRQMSGRDERC